MKALRSEVQGLESQLETRRVVDRAKGMLMDEHAMKEGYAFSFIQRTAMRESKKMKAVAERIISGELRP